MPHAREKNLTDSTITTSALANGEVQDSSQELFAFPASIMQRRLWFLDQMTPGSSLYNIPDAVRIVGPLDLDALNRSVQELVQRHESFRTFFQATKGEPQQVIAREIQAELPIPIIIANSETKEQREAAVRRHIEQLMNVPFNLYQAPLWRLRLYRIAEDDHVLATVVHHIIFDAWSLGVLWRDVAQIYAAFVAGRPSPLPELPIQYADFSEWQREYLQGKVLEEQLGYWKARLTGTKALNLPFDRPRPSTPSSKGALHSFMLEDTLTQRLRRLSQQHTATLYMTLLAAWQTLLFRYTGQTDISVGSAIAGRTRHEVKDLVGFFVNTLVMRTKLSGHWSFHELLQNVKETTLGAYEHQEIPFDRLVQELSPDRDAKGPVIFQLTFNLQNVPIPKVRLGRAELSSFRFEVDSPKFDISVFLIEAADGGISFDAGYNRELFDADTIAEIFERYRILLQSVVENPGEALSKLALLTAEERRSAAPDWSTPEFEGPAGTICERIQEWAQRNPDAPAIISGAREISYRQLNERANQLAHWLQARGIRPAAHIGIYLEQPEKQLLASLGILKAGAVLVPLSLEDPVQRVHQIVTDAGLALVMTESRCAERCSSLGVPLLNIDLDEADLAKQSLDELGIKVPPQALACVLYRSAPANKPEGILIPHWALSNKRFGTEMDLRASDRVAQNVSFSFELVAFDIFAALAAGACTVAVPNNPALSTKDLAELLHRHAVTVIFMSTATMTDLSQQAPGILEQFRLLLCADRFTALKRLRETLTPELMDRVYWLYGSTEAFGSLVASKATKLNLELESTPIEHLARGSRFYVLDEEMSLVPDGALGELYVSTDVMAMGYENDPARTAESFVPDLFSTQGGMRLYRTGDLCRRKAGPRLQFCGRRDTRTKIYGIRVELAEIEAHLLEHPQVRDAAVILHEKAGLREASLVAFTVGSPEQANAEELRKYLAQRLPESMLPIEYMRLESIPRTDQRKPDIDALVKILEEAAKKSDDIPAYVAPRNSFEEQLAQIWAETFELERVGIHDNFFKLGGHSMIATVVVAQIIDIYNVDLPVRRLFQAPTIAQLAKIVEQLTLKAEDGSAMEVQEEPPQILVKMQPEGAAPPFFFVHAVGGHVFCYAELATALGTEQPFYALQAPSPGQINSPITTIEEIAELYLQEIRRVQPEGPYFLGGWSLGGVIAWEMTRQAGLEGGSVALLALIDSALPVKNRGGKEQEDVSLLTGFAIDLCQLIGKDPREFSDKFLRLGESEQYGMILEVLQKEGVLPQDPLLAQKRLQDFYEVYKCHAQAVREYQLTPMDQETIFCQATESAALVSAEQWAAWTPKLTSYTLQGNHYSIIKQPTVSVVAGHLCSFAHNALNKTLVGSN